jgi:putative transposase
MRTARIKDRGGACYHCMSRVIDRRYALGDREKEVFRRVMRQCEEFCGVRVVDYALMDNHFHCLVEVSPREEIPDAELLRRLECLYTAAEVGEIGRQLEGLRAAGDEAGADRLRQRYLRRMYDLSEFMKTLKQRFTQWYNRQHQRRGTLWEERFKSVLVEGSGHALSAVAAYIDLNPVRAGLVSDPKDYRYCGYAEAVAGGARAQAGLVRVMQSLGGSPDWSEASRQYRELLYVLGQQTEQRAGFSPEQVRQVLESGGRLSLAQVLRCRVRYFSDGVALGSREFVESIFQEHRSFFGAKRTSGARPMRHADWGGLCTARDLRREAVCLPV